MKTGIKSFKPNWPQLKNYFLFCFLLRCLRVSKFSVFESSKVSSTYLGSSAFLSQTTIESTGKWKYSFLIFTKPYWQNKWICIPDSNVQAHHLGIKFYSILQVKQQHLAREGCTAVVSEDFLFACLTAETN